MTSHLVDHETQPWPPGPDRAWERWAVFGREARYVTGLYLRRALIFSGIALAIVLALDVAANMALVQSLNSGTGGIGNLAALAGYIALRAAFVIPDIFPVAAIMGVVWAEFGLARSGERVMVFCSGRAPLRSVVPAIVVGAALGLAQFAALSFSRPYSTEVQAVLKYRGYGPRYVSAATEGAEWFVSDDAVFNARIEFGPPVALTDIVVYQLSPDGRLESIIRAARANPASVPGSWTFHHGTIWTFGWAPDAPAGWTAASRVAFDATDLSIALDPSWAAYIDIKPGLLPMPVLHGLATAASGIPNGVTYKAAYQQRYAALLTSIAVALVGASLSLVLFSPHVKPTTLLQIALVGYGVHISTTVLRLLGDNGFLSLALAIWAPPVLLIAASLFLLYRYDRRVQFTIAGRTEERANLAAV